MITRNAILLPLAPQPVFQPPSAPRLAVCCLHWRKRRRFGIRRWRGAFFSPLSFRLSHLTLACRHLKVKLTFGSSQLLISRWTGQFNFARFTQLWPVWARNLVLLRAAYFCVNGRHWRVAWQFLCRCQQKHHHPACPVENVEIGEIAGSGISRSVLVFCCSRLHLLSN